MSKPGRPPIDPSSPSVPLTFRLPSREYDEIYACARVSRMTVPEWIRRMIGLSHAIKNSKIGPPPE
jgi:hypothetical protein